MNLTSADPTAPPPPPPPPRSSFSCDRHPTEQFTGFCPTCLCERLITLDKSSSNTPSSSRRPSSASAAAAAIKSIFSLSTSKPPPPPPPPAPKSSSKPASFFPELRRTKSFSASKNEALGLIFEPQRKSCDVRVRNTLLSLLTLDNESEIVCTNSRPSISPCSSHQNSNPQISNQIDPSVVFEETEREEDFKDAENAANGAVVYDDSNGSSEGEIRSGKDSHVEINLEANSGEIVEEEVVNVSNLKPMKDHIEIDSHGKKSSGSGGFWAAASVFSKKWHSWRKKQKLKKQNNGSNFATLPFEKPISRQYRETQSEIADYGFGRRSCDIDPRFSLDAGRISFDDSRYSFDEPRASWDGYLVGRSFPRMAPMVSVMEDVPAVHVPRSDMHIPVEEPVMNCGYNEEDEAVPGGTAQTREYYLDSSSRRRKSLDRSTSIRRAAAAVVAEIDELKTVSNAKVLPATGECFQGAKVVVGERDLNSYALRNDCSEIFGLSSEVRDNGSSMVVNGGDRKEVKKSRRWSWKLWGFIQRRNGGNKDEDDDEKCSRRNGVDRLFSEFWQDSRMDSNGDATRAVFNKNMFRSNSSVSWRNSNHIGGSMRRPGGFEVNGHWKKRNEFVLEKNRCARYSPNHVENGLLRLYLAPMRNSRRGVALGKAKPNNTHSSARSSVLRLY